MENTRNRIAIAIVTVLLVSSTLLLINFAGVANVQAQTGTSASYGNILNYPWPIGPGCDSGNSFFNPGPGPNTPNVVWEDAISPTSAPCIAANGYIYEYNSTYWDEINAFTGQVVWSLPINSAQFNMQTTPYNDNASAIVYPNATQTPRGFGTGTSFMLATSGPDSTYMGVQYGSGVYVVNTLTGLVCGKYILSPRDDTTALGGGSVIYWGGFYSTWDMMDYGTGLTLANQTAFGPDPNGLIAYSPCMVAVAFNMSNPTAPYVQWETILPTGCEALCTAPGLAIFGGYGEGQLIALNATTGKTVWTTFTQGNTGYLANYDPSTGLIYQDASATRIVCVNATNGAVVFDQSQGPRNFFAFGGALAYGRFYDKNIATPLGYVGCWSASTGAELWQTPAEYMIAYLTPCVADGKVYVTQYSGTTTSAEVSEITTFSCFDAMTGQVLWQAPCVSTTDPIVAYGNLYLENVGQLQCIGDKPYPWSQWAGGSATNALTSSSNGVANNGNPQVAGTTAYGAPDGAYAPDVISYASWHFTAGGPVCGSIVADNGMVYFGSLDGNIYAVNALTGSLEWKFQTNYRVESTPCVTAGVVYTGADDGNVYALNATTGAEIWSCPCYQPGSGGPFTQVFWISAWQPRSSPVVWNGKLYVGSLDGNLYCINTLTGVATWHMAAGNVTYPIGGTPLVANNTAAASGESVYICSGNSFIYAFDANTGAPEWATQLEGQTSFNIRSLVSTPIAENGTLWVANGYSKDLDALNETTGQIMIVYPLPYSTASGSMTPANTTPCYVNLNASTQMLIVGDGFQTDALNITRISLNQTLVNGYLQYYTNMTGTYYIDKTYTASTVKLANGLSYGNLTAIANAILAQGNEAQFTVNNDPNFAANEQSAFINSYSGSGNIYDHMPGESATMGIPDYATLVNSTAVNSVTENYTTGQPVNTVFPLGTNRDQQWIPVFGNGTGVGRDPAFNTTAAAITAGVYNSLIGYNYKDAYSSTNRTGEPGYYLPIGNDTYLPTVWAQWQGHQVYSSPIYCNSLTWPVLYFGDDVYSMTCENATNGAPITSFSALGQIFGTACIYDGRMFLGSQDGNVYCFANTQTATMAIYAAASKTTAMWDNETLSIAGTVKPTITVLNGYGDYAANGLYNATVDMTITLPSGSSLNMTTTTDAFGNYAFSYNPTTPGSYGWVVYYPGQTQPLISYDAAYTQWTPITVSAPPSSVATTTPTPTPTSTSTPTTTKGTSTTTYIIIAIVAIIIVIIAAVGAYLYTRRGKKPQ